MAKIMNSDALSRKIDALTIQNEYLKDFLQIYKHKFEEKNTKKLISLELKLKEEILPYEICAGILSEYLIEKKNYEIKKVEEKYYWKFRELKQTRKRTLENHSNSNEAILKSIDEKEMSLKSNNLLELEEIENKYKPNDQSTSCMEKYLEKKEENEKLYSIYKDKLSNDLKNKYNRLLDKTNIKINYNLSKINELSNQVSNFSNENESGYILQVKNLGMRFGGLKAVDDLSFDVKEGEIFGLIGPNGAGKTTVFNCITQFYKGTGEIIFKNKLNNQVLLNDYKVHNVIRLGISRTFQNVELIWEISVLENLLVGGHTLYQTGFFGNLLNTSKLKQEEAVLRKKALDILEKLDLLPYKDLIPYGLPYGILKKIELARTLMINPRLIILDEPAAGLNDVETIALKHTILKIRDEYKTTIFLVEHDMGLVMDICDTVCAISFGKKIAIGSPAEIQQNKYVREAYLGGE